MNKFDGINSIIKAPGIEAFCNNVIRANKYNNNNNNNFSNYSLFSFDENQENDDNKNDDDKIVNDNDNDDNNNLSSELNYLCSLTQKNDQLLNECFKLSQELQEQVTPFMKESQIRQQLEREGDDNLIFELKKIIFELNLKQFETKIIQFIKRNDIHWCDFDKISQRRSFVQLLSLQSRIKPLGKCIKLWVKMHKVFVNKIDINNNNNNGLCEISIKEQEINEIPKQKQQQQQQQRSLIFISEQCTNYAISGDIMIEYFGSSKQLFHYLRWTIKMQQIDGFYKIFNIKNNKNIVIFNTELHDNKNGEYLYIIGSDNDKITAKSPKWKMEKFLTGKEIFDLYGIKEKYLPIGSRANSKSFKNSIKQNYQRRIIIYGYFRDNKFIFEQPIINLLCYMYYDPFCKKYKYSSINHIGMESFCKLPQIKTQQKKELHKIAPNELQYTSYQFYKHICEGINSLNIKHEFISIVSFDKHKTSYFIDLLLPIKLPTNNWIGIIFRNYIPISICIDCNDIKTKCKLFDANYNISQYEWMKNNMTRLSIKQVPLQHNIGKKNKKQASIKLIPLQQKR